MKNVGVKVVGKTLTLTIDLDQDHGFTKGGAGRNKLIASTSGTRPLKNSPDIFVGLNVFKKPAAKGI